MTQSQISAMLLGAFVADAASLGVHWIYDPNRITEIAQRQNGRTAFTPVDADNYADVAGYFAHGLRRNGMLTQYGEVLRLAIQSIITEGGFDVSAYQTAFAAHFGAGGPYKGYIDRPTRAALDNIAAERNPSGIDDDQNPAVARLPAIFARYRGQDTLSERISASMEVTNINSIAAAYSAAYADVLSRILKHHSLADALQAAAETADSSIKADLLDALTTDDDNSTEYAGVKGRACHLPTAGPVSFHILKHSNSFRDAVERNNLAGGDSAGRAIFIGAVMGMVHGIATPSGIPLAWALHLEDGAGIWSECEALAG